MCDLEIEKICPKTDEEVTIIVYGRQNAGMRGPKTHSADCMSKHLTDLKGTYCSDHCSVLEELTHFQL